MLDVQSREDKRGIAIQRVGISKAVIPLRVEGNKARQVTATVEKFTVDLPHFAKGTHMSRFMEVLQQYNDCVLDAALLDALLTSTLEKLAAHCAHIEISFKYFIEKKAPVSGKASLLDIDCAFIASKKKGKSLDFALSLAVPVTSLCPCSKEISSYGAHNQRSMIKTKVYFRAGCYLTPDELAGLLEEQASSPVYPILKRSDEKYVTEKAYDNPKFVEDILRDTVLLLRKREEISAFEIECENMESIHNHNAYAFYGESKPKE